MAVGKTEFNRLYIDNKEIPEWICFNTLSDIADFMNRFVFEKKKINSLGPSDMRDYLLSVTKEKNGNLRLFLHKEYLLRVPRLHQQ